MWQLFQNLRKVLQLKNGRGRVILAEDSKKELCTFTNSLYINCEHWRLGSDKRLICLRTSTSKGTCKFIILSNQKHDKCIGNHKKHI